MFWIAIIGTFLVPIYYQARGKGYNARLITALTAFHHALLSEVFVASGNPWFLLPMLAIPASVLGILYTAGPRAGAPGTMITFACPNCDRSIALPRQRSGLVALCPECGETLTVPGATERPKPLGVERPKPNVREGPVIFATYTDASDAECLANVLTENGVPAETIHEDSSGVMPPVIREISEVVIDVADWEHAVSVSAGNT